MKTLTRITSRERDLLAIWKAEGISNKECGRRLNRHTSTIGRELKRNRFQSVVDGNYRYASIHAQQKALERRFKSAHSKHPLKNPFIYGYVTEKLREGWSPDAIAGRLKFDYPNDPSCWIVHETIYQWIYSNDQLKYCWFEYLRRKQKKRKKKSGRKVHCSHIPDRVSISQRPEVANLRLEFGHWESDSVEGTKHQNGLHTEIERISRKYSALKVNAITSEQAVGVQKQLFTQYPPKARISATMDNGRENHLHYQLKGIGMDTYFAHPYCSWERGANEHGNWLIRYYFPKGTDFSKISQEEVDDVVEEINNRPRKILGYKTANEVFNYYLNSLESDAGVAINY